MALKTPLWKQVINYAKTGETYVAYRMTGYSSKFYESHKEEMSLHMVAKAAFDQLETSTISKAKELNAEYAE